jgi:hypothetical protein
MMRIIKIHFFIFLIVAFLAGGLSSADVEIYSPNGNCSNLLAPLPDETASPRLAYINQEIFYCPSQNTIQCYVYDAETDNWNTTTSMNHIHNKTTSKHILAALFLVFKFETLSK